MSAPGSSFGRPSCPCGTGEAFDACCGPLLQGAALAATPEQLMRSRYTAFAVGDADHLLRTWHPRTRPERVDLDPSSTWTGLVVHAAEEDRVEFTATWDDGSRTGEVHERSRFARRAGRWLYVDGEVDGVG